MAEHEHKIEPNDCIHKRLHPARVDGSMTVCLDCRRPVQVLRVHYANGKPTQVQFDELLEALREEYIRNPHAY